MKKIRSFIWATFFLAVIAMPVQALAATVQLYLSPASQSVQVGNSFTVKVYVNTTVADGYVKANIKFPAANLQVTSLSTTNTAYPYYATQTYDNGAGTLSFAGYGSYQTGSALLVGTITFKAKAAGTASVTFKNTSVIAYSQYNNNDLTSTSGGTYTLTNPVTPTCPTGQIGTPPNCTTPTSGDGGSTGGSTGGTTGGTTGGSTGGTTGGTTSTSGSTGTTTTSQPKTTTTTKTTNNPIVALIDPNKLNISEPEANVDYDHGTITWTTNYPTPTKVEYGLDADNLDQNQSFAEKVTDHNVTLVNLVPGKRYYYRIAASADNGQTANFEGQFTTSGFPVEITITTPNKKPVKNVHVTIDGESFTTDTYGKVQAGLSAENHTVIVSANRTSKTFSLNVEAKDIPTDGSEPEVQSFTFVVPKANNLLFVLGGSILLVLLLAAAGYILLKALKHSKKKLYKKAKPASRTLPLVHKELIKEEPALPPAPKPQPVPEPEPIHHKPAPPLPEVPKAPQPPAPKLVPPAPKQAIPVPPLPPLHEDLPHMVARANAAKAAAPAGPDDEPEDMFEVAEKQFHYDEKFKNPPHHKK